MLPAMKTRTLLLLSLPLLVCCKKGFGSGFEGEITMHTTRAGGPAKDLVVETKGDKLRFDSDGTAGKSWGVYDPSVSASKVVMVMDEQKAFMDLDFSSPSAPQANTNADTSTIDKNGKKDNVAGIDCQTWTAKDASGKRSEVCIAEGIAFFDIGSLKSGGSPLSKELREKKLFPMRTVEYDASGNEVSRTEVTKVDKKKIDDARFTVPADYKKVALPGM
jgi:hypothetical protein